MKKILQILLYKNATDLYIITYLGVGVGCHGDVIIKKNTNIRKSDALLQSLQILLLFHLTLSLCQIGPSFN